MEPTLPDDKPTDPLPPQAMALKADAIGTAKARLDAVKLITLAILAGAFIALGAMFSTVLLTGAGELPYGVGRLLAGLAFAIGLILVVVGGAELFTGNNLMVMAWASGNISGRALLRAWALVYVGNLVGAAGTAALVFLSGHHMAAGGEVGATALAIASAKVGLGPLEAFFLGVLCNVLVCLAVWLCLGARTTTDRILAVLWPIAAFVAAGFEHSVANMYFIPYALLIKWVAADGFWTAASLAPAQFAALDLWGFLRNLLPVTLGNMVGGGVLVGAVYWFVYLRERR